MTNHDNITWEIQQMVHNITWEICLGWVFDLVKCSHLSGRVTGNYDYII